MRLYFQIFLLILIAHLGLLLVTSNEQKESQKATTPKTGQHKVKINQPSEIGRARIFVPKNELEKKECPDFYYGVGLSYNPLFRTITDIGKSYPAEKAGIEVGDDLVSINPQSIKENDIVKVVIKRNGVLTTYHLLAEKICTQGTK